MPVRGETLRQRLDALVDTFDVTTIEPDPLQLVLRYDDPRDQEVAGLLAAAFAYGRADVVVANVGRVLGNMVPSPYEYLVNFDRAEALRHFAGFTHRFHKAPELVSGLGTLVSETDIRAVTPEFADYLARTFRTALGTGIGGWRDDDLAFVRDWGVPLKARCPVSVWHGGQDRMVPLHHGRWLVANWDGARDRLQPGDGHLTLAAAGFADVLDDLLRDA